MIKTAFLSILTLLSLLGYGQQTDNDLFLKVDSLRIVHDVPSVSLAIISNGKILWAEGLGIKSSQTKDSVDHNTSYQAASISKSITAIGTLALIQSDQIGLKDNVNNHLKSWKINIGKEDSVITPFHLLSHTTGLITAHFYGYKAHKPIPNLIQVLDGEKPAKSKAIVREKSAGFEYMYSGSGYCILQQLIEDKTNKSFDSAINSLVFSPFDMRSCTYSFPTNLKNIAQAHYKGKPLKNGFMVYPELAAAGLWTTPSNLALLLIKLGKCWNQESQIISSDIITAMLTPTKTADGKVNDYGLGFMLDQQANGLHIGHTGSTAGYRCFMKYNIDKDYGVVIMTNSANGIPLIDNLVEYLANYFVWENFTPSF